MDGTLAEYLIKAGLAAPTIAFLALCVSVLGYALYRFLTYALGKFEARLQRIEEALEKTQTKGEAEQQEERFQRDFEHLAARSLDRVDRIEKDVHNLWAAMRDLNTTLADRLNTFDERQTEIRDVVYEIKGRVGA